MELTLNFKVGVIKKILNAFVKNNSKSVECNYRMLVNINRLNNLDEILSNEMVLNSCSISIIKFLNT